MNTGTSTACSTLAGAPACGAAAAMSRRDRATSGPDGTNCTATVAGCSTDGSASTAGTYCIARPFPRPARTARTSSGPPAGARHRTSPSAAATAAPLRPPRPPASSSSSLPLLSASSSSSSLRFLPALMTLSLWNAMSDRSSAGVASPNRNGAATIAGPSVRAYTGTSPLLVSPIVRVGAAIVRTAAGTAPSGSAPASARSSGSAFTSSPAVLVASSSSASSRITGRYTWASTSKSGLQDLKAIFGVLLDKLTHI